MEKTVTAHKFPDMSSLKYLRRAARVRHSPERGFPLNELLIVAILLVVLIASVVTTIVGWRSADSWGAFWASRSLLGKAWILFPGMLFVPWIVMVPIAVVDVIRGPKKDGK